MLRIVECLVKWTAVLISVEVVFHVSHRDYPLIKFHCIKVSRDLFVQKISCVLEDGC